MDSVTDAPSLLRLAAPHLAPELVDQASFDRLDGFAALLPAAFSIGAFECRLDGRAERVDYSLCVRDGSAARQRLRAADSVPVAAPPWWSALRADLRRWAARSDRAASPVVWVEVDVPAPDATADACRPFLIHTLRESRADDVEVRSRDIRMLAAEALRLEADDELLAGIEGLMRRLPEWCALRHVALRPTFPRILRAICRMPCTRARDFAFGGPDGSVGRAIERLALLGYGHPGVTNVNLDLTPELGPRVGVEFHFAGTPAEDARWNVLFDELEALQLLSPTKRHALAAWPSGAAERHPQRASPDTVVRDLMIKVDFDATGPATAKAYLPFGLMGMLRQSGRPGTMAAA